MKQVLLKGFELKFATNCLSGARGNQHYINTNGAEFASAWATRRAAEGRETLWLTCCFAAQRYRAFAAAARLVAHASDAQDRIEPAIESNSN
jgi:hypothetical protein